MKRVQYTSLILSLLLINLQSAESQLPEPNIFAVRGTVYAADGVTPLGIGMSVTVENLTQGVSGTDTTGATAGPGQYVVTFVDLNTSVVNVGDLIQVKVGRATGEVLATEQIPATATDLQAGFLILDLILPSANENSFVFAVSGTVLLSDGTIAGDGLAVTVENLSKGFQQSDVTGAFAGPSRYVVTFLDTDNPVAGPGDEIQVRVTDSTGAALGEAQVMLTTNIAAAQFAIIDVTVSSPPHPPPPLVVRGKVFAYDATTPAGDGLRITVSDPSKNLVGSDTTNENSEYAVTLVSTDGFVFEAGNTVEIRIQDGRTPVLLEETTKTINQTEVDQGETVVDIVLPSLSWDVNGDRTVNIFDLVRVASNFGQTVSDPPAGFNPDVNRDGIVNIFDLVIIAGRFGESYNPPAAPPHIRAASEARLSLELTQTADRRYRLDLSAEAVSDLAGFQFDVAFQPEQIEIVSISPGTALEADGKAIYWNNPTPSHQQGTVSNVAAVRLSPFGVSQPGILATIDFRLISPANANEVLPRLHDLHLVDSQGRWIAARVMSTLDKSSHRVELPNATRLLRNYPNPFNPETWIPYHLAKASPVHIKIHDIHGYLVRSLDLGVQSAGVYESADRAARWDGRNNVGEPVSSGVYFYSLHTADYSNTRKLIIAK